MHAWGRAALHGVRGGGAGRCVRACAASHASSPPHGHTARAAAPPQLSFRGSCVAPVPPASPMCAMRSVVCRRAAPPLFLTFPPPSPPARRAFACGGVSRCGLACACVADGFCHDVCCLFSLCTSPAKAPVGCCVSPAVMASKQCVTLGSQDVTKPSTDRAQQRLTALC